MSQSPSQQRAVVSPVGSQGVRSGKQISSGTQTLLKQISLSPHAPQSWVSPQVSTNSPQAKPISVHVGGVQPPQTPAVPLPPQLSGAVQVPQSIVPPHPSRIEPQFLPCSTQVVGVQPQALVVPPPPQVSGKVQSPQSRNPPQWSDGDPQFTPSDAHVAATQQNPLIQGTPSLQSVSESQREPAPPG